MSQRADEPRRSHTAFTTTRWSLVVAAADPGHPQSAAALSELCAAYWYPVYAFLRRRGFQADRAEDLAQEFFAGLLEKQSLKAARPERGRFRSFLLTALKFFLSHELERANARKRGGGQRLIPLDADTAEGRYRREPADKETPETLFERRWALELIERALERLRTELSETRQPARSLRLIDYLTGAASAPYERVAAELGMSESAVKVALHRLRGRYRTLLREEVLQTVDGPEHVDDELRHLFGALGTRQS